jgi:hypothetical protein
LSSGLAALGSRPPLLPGSARVPPGPAQRARRIDGSLVRSLIELPAAVTGGRIVAEVLTGLIYADPGSYSSVDPGWAPTLPSRGACFGLVDLLVPVDDD